MLIAPDGAFRNCLNQLYFKPRGRGIGYSFQLAITAPLYSITGYNGRQKQHDKMHSTN